MSKNYVFNTVPRIYYRRSVQDLSHGHLTTGNVGDLIPFYIQEVYPGDSMKGHGTVVCRTTTPFIKPVFGNLFVDMMYFFVPTRLIVNNVGRLFGENTSGAWAPSNTPAVQPVIASSDSAGVSKHTVANYLGWPLGVKSTSTQNGVSVLPFRAFALVYNDWFRDENLVPPVDIKKGWNGDTGQVEFPPLINGNAFSASNYLGLVPKVSKVHDYFTSCLPAPQKGISTTVPITLSDIPVGTKSVSVPTSIVGASFPSLGFYAYNKTSSTGGISLTTGASTPYKLASNTTSQSGVESSSILQPGNLWAQPSAVNSAGSVSVNDLRYSFALQRILERSARGGSRYVEYIRSTFGTEPGDVRMQRPEYLGGSRNPISVQQVTQTTGSSEENNTLAELGAFSLSSGHARFNKGFTEHGYILGVLCVRYFHTYSQGLERFWSRLSRYDFYDPAFAHLSEQPVYQSEIFFNGTNAGGSNRAIFGYNEPYADLRFRPNRISGQFTESGSGLNVWSFFDEYTTAPTLSQAFIEETPTYVDRCLSAPSTTIDNFMFDIWTDCKAVRVLPARGVPGLVDHLGNQ
nr:MAG TPA: Major capsid protein [Microviridae sp.]